MSYSVIYDAGIKRFFGPQGPVARIIKGKADLIESHAAANIAATFESRTGELADSLKQVPFERDGVAHIAVGADAQHRGFPYARALELSQDPRTGGPLLAGNNQQTPVEDKAYMVPAVKAAGFKQRS